MSKTIVKEGWAYKDAKQFTDLLIKANIYQLEIIMIEAQVEMKRRKDRGNK